MSMKGRRSVKVNFSLAPQVADYLKFISEKKGMTRSAIVALALDKLKHEEEIREKEKM